MTRNLFLIKRLWKSHDLPTDPNRQHAARHCVCSLTKQPAAYAARLAEGIAMNQDRFTEKSLEALNAANRLALKFNHQQMDVEHLLLALLDQEHGLAPSILNKAEISMDAVKIKVQREVEKIPRVTGGGDNVSITGRLNRLLGQAEDEAKKMKD